MDITRYAAALRESLAQAGRAGGPETAAAAERLALTLDPALRMTLLEVLSQAADEITSALGGGAVEVRLRGRDPEFVVTSVPARTASPGPAAPGAEDDIDEDGGPVARFTLRLPKSLKQRAENAAGRRGQSLNTWLVNAVRSAARERVLEVDLDLASIPFGPGIPGRNRRGRAQRDRRA